MALLAVLALLGWLYFAVANGAFWRPYIASVVGDPATWPSVDIIVPARNDARCLPRSLASLLAQKYPGPWRIILVDDHSKDGTGKLALELAQSAGQPDRLTVINAPDVPKGWGGKVAAMQAGAGQSKAEYILFTDAGIEYPANSLRRLMARALNRKLDLMSLMARLHCATAAEKLLIPAFVFFFTMLYPFRRANNPKSDVAAAPGGVMLVRRRALDNAGGLAAIKAAMIDDCALAKLIKRGGGELSSAGQIELSMVADVKSLRVYPGHKKYPTYGGAKRLYAIEAFALPAGWRDHGPVLAFSFAGYRHAIWQSVRDGCGVYRMDDHERTVLADGSVLPITGHLEPYVTARGPNLYGCYNQLRAALLAGQGRTGEG